MAPGFLSSMESQRAFRAFLDAMSRPGRVVSAGETLKPPAPMHPSFGAVCLTLLDFETPIWTDLPTESAALEWLLFHCGAPSAVAPRDASFVLITQPRALCPIDRFHPGEEERPERGATVLVQVEGIGTDCGLGLTGPGIETHAGLHIHGLPSSFWEERARMNSRFPLGLDFIFTVNRDLVALPRTTRVGPEPCT
ncbi:MAG: phosphonate C-P lyase system protein PhnH [Desulfobacteraceae bacterium]|jgi:alpha-D-ribose 1-methylphosphonate 5-triphosphate synthase subunit PhnH